MLYSASRRTDMVAFAPDAIVGRVARSRKLDGIVFWTKDIRNFVNHAGLAGVIARVPGIVQFTATGLAGSVWEPGVPPLKEQLPALHALAERLPPGAIRWRFDPVIKTPRLRERFRTVKNLLAGALPSLAEVTASFPDPYKKAVARAAACGLEWPEMSMEEKRDFVGFMVDELAAAGSPAPVRLCCEPELLALPGVRQVRCVDDGLFRDIYGLRLELGGDAGQRQACGCAQSTDIGTYELSCPHRCRYCYANPQE